MKKTLVFIFVGVISIIVMLGALGIGYQIGKRTKPDTAQRTPLNDQNQPQVFINPSSVELPVDTVSSYAQNCAACHGINGGGSPMAPALNSSELRARLDDAGIAETITNGRTGTAMPPWKNRLSTSQIDALTSLIRNWDQLDQDQLFQLEEQAKYQQGMGGWQGHNPMMGGGCNSGSGMGWHGWRSP